jgi:hypothetical protein
MDKKLRKPKTAMKKVQVKDLQVKDHSKVKGGMNKAELLDGVAKRSGLTKPS